MEYDGIKTVIRGLIARLGWAATHYFNSKRDCHLKRKEVITSHLINAYRVLTYDITRRNLSVERKIELVSKLICFLQRKRFSVLFYLCTPLKTVFPDCFLRHTP